jgi:hypothetical protein
MENQFYIRIGQKRMHFFINDLLKNEGGFLSLEQFQDKYGTI